MYTLFLVGMAVMINDSSHHHVKFEMQQFESKQVCEQSASQIAEAVKQNLGGAITITDSECKKG